MALTDRVIMPGADYQAICDAVRAKTGGTNVLKSGEIAPAITGITAGGTAEAGKWQRPADWPNYDFIDRTGQEVLFLTYDCRYAIADADIEDWMAIYAKGTTGYKVERGYIDSDGFHAVSSSDMASGSVYLENLPTNEGNYVVYRVTPGAADGHLTIVTMTRPDGASNDALYAQHCIERWGRLPYVEGFGTSAAYRRWGCRYVQAESIIDVSNVTTLASCWQNCNSLQSIDLSGWDVGNVTTLASCWSGCYSLQNLDLSGWDVSNVTTLASCWRYCYSLQSLAPCPLYLSFSVSDSGLLSVKSLLALLDALPVISETQTVTLSTTSKAKLTEEQLAIAAEKGWTIA